MSDLESLLEYSQIVSQLFACEDEGFRFYNAYGLKKGFSGRRSYVEWDAGHNEMTLWKFDCSREGFHEEKHMNMENKQRRPRGITRVGCRAKFVIARQRNTGQMLAHLAAYFNANQTNLQNSVQIENRWQIAISVHSSQH